MMGMEEHKIKIGEKWLEGNIHRCGLDRGCLGTVKLPKRNTEEGQSTDLQVTLARKPLHFHCPPDYIQIKTRTYNPLTEGKIFP